MESNTIQNQFEAMKPLLEEYISKILQKKTIVTEQQIRQISLLERIVRVEEELKALRELSEERFAASDKRFEEMQRSMDKRFEEMHIYMDKRFEAVDKRFEAVDKRFEAVDKRFEDMKNYSDKRFTQLTWVISIAMTLIATLMTLFKFIV